jgi:hypothetical protein
MPRDPWPEALPDFLTWFDLFTQKLAIHGPALGIAAARVTQARAEYVWLFFAVNDTANAEAEWHERVQWRDTFFEEPEGTALGSYPTNNSVTIPVGSPPPAGVLVRLRATVQQCKRSPAYTEPIGAELGILTPPPAPRPPAPSPKATAGENSHVLLDCPLQGWDAVEIESRRGTGGWELLAVCLKRKYTDTRAPLVAGQPEVREYRMRFRDGDVAQEQYSDVVRVTTKP